MTVASGPPPAEDAPISRTAPTAGPARWPEVLAVALRLGLTSFGGPVAHLGYFREEYVARRRWLDDRTYADLVALCQFLPGPASSQVGIAIGLSRAGYAGALAAWVGFTLPSAVALVLFAYGVAAVGDPAGAGWLNGLRIAAVAVVAQAVLGMVRTLAPDRERATIAVLAAVLVLAVPTAAGQVGAILLAGLAGRLVLPGQAAEQTVALPLVVSRRAGAVALAVFAVLLVALPLLAAAVPSQALRLVDVFYRAGSLVFGGGHVVLPLLEAAVVPPGWVSQHVFMAGYGATQAVPGPLFTFSAYLGAAMGPEPNGWRGGLVALLAVFLPSFLLVIGALPFWERLRRAPAARSALAGINAGVVGLLMAALYDPVWTTAIHGPADVGLAAVAFLLLGPWKVPPWMVVALCAAAGSALAAL
ncbi:chromate efflux transporter [Alsobacter sp. R-9]